MSKDGIVGLDRRLRALFDLLPYSDAQVCARCADLGIDITPAYLGQMRSGKRDNPSAKKLWGLARVFGVTMESLMSDQAAEATTRELGRLNQLSRLADEAAKPALSDEQILAVQKLLEQQRRARTHGEDS